MNWNPDIGIPLAIAGALLLVAIAFFGRPRKPRQGRRLEPGETGIDAGGSRSEPRWDADPDAQEEMSFGAFDAEVDEDSAVQRELDALERALGSDDVPEPATPEESERGRRSGAVPERIVTLFVAARDDQMIDGASIVVAAERAGLVYGSMGIFHRLVEGHPDAEPVFSVASMVKPGHFDLRNVHDIETPGLTFFMTLPGPMSAFDAWETMLPTAQRMAELLDATVLDEDRNALARQRIAHMRAELREFDRAREKEAQRRW